MSLIAYYRRKSISIKSTNQSPKEGKSVVMSERIINTSNNELIIERIDDFFFVTIGSNRYKLDRTQYKAIIRKKNMPKDRLEVWLETYAEENN